MVVYFLQALLRGHSEMLKKILTPAVFSQLDGTVAASLEKDREVVHKLETLLTTMVVDESAFSGDASSMDDPGSRLVAPLVLSW